jgi:hypothetical protein
MADLLGVHDFIVTSLDTAMTAIHAAFVDGAWPDGDEIPTLPNGQVRPHAFLWLGDGDMYPGQQSIDENAIRDSLDILPFVVGCVGTTNRELTQVRDAVHRAIRGKWVPDGGQIKHTGGVSEQPQRGALKPQRLFRMLEFEVTVGASGLVPA